MLDNLIKIYLNQDGSLKNSNIDPIYKLSNQSVIVELVAPFANTSGVYVKFLLSNNAGSPVRSMQLMGTELVEGDTWNRWQYRMPSSILASASKLQAQSFLVSFFIQDLPFVVSDGFRFQGFFDTLTDLQIAVPQPSLSQPVDFAGVSGGLISEQAILYAGGSIGQAVGWTTQPSAADANVPKTVQEFVEENNIERVNRSRATTQVKVAIAPSVAGTTGEIEIVDINQTSIIANRLAAIEGSLADIEASYVRQDFELANYAEVSQLDDDDQFFMNYGNYQDPRYVEASQIKSYVQQGVEFVANKGATDGYAPLVNGKLPSSFLPDDVIQFKGTFGSITSTTAVEFGTGGDLPQPQDSGRGDTYLCEVAEYFSVVADEIFFLQDEAIWDGANWKKVGGVGSVKEAPLGGEVVFGRNNGQWVDVRTVIAPFLYKRDVTITQPNVTTLNVGLSEFEAEDSVFVYENGILLIEGINYSFNSTTGDITFLSSGQPGDATYNIPDVGSIITIQLIKKAVFSGFVGSASGVNFDPQQTNLITATNVQLAIEQLLAGVYTQEQLETPGQALVSGENVAGSVEGNSIFDDIEAITWKGTLPAQSNLSAVPTPAAGDVYAVLLEQTIFIFRNGQWVQILAPGQVPVDGNDGADAVVGFLTQPAAILTQDANLDIVYTGSGTDVIVFEGNTPLIPQAGVTTQPGEFNVILELANNITIGAFSIPAGLNVVRIGNHSDLSNITQPASIRLRVEGRRANGDAFQFILNQAIALAPRVAGPAGADGVDGADGTNGTDGTSVVLKGSVATVPDLDLIINPEVGDLYVVLADGNGYVYNGASWDNVGQIQGPDGADGANGADGTDGVDGADGNNFAVVNLYIRTSTNIAPTGPSNLSGEYNFTTSTLTNLAGNLNGFEEEEPPVLVDPDDRYLWVVSFTLSSVNNPLTFSGVSTTAPRILSVNGTPGQNGDAGPEGPTGPGVVFRGLWDTNKQYFRTPVRADIVSAFTGSPATLKYYIALQNNISINPTDTTNWALFENQFDMVATNILLTDNATITRGLVMGAEGANSGFIRSANSSAINSGTGFFMNNNGELSLGSTAGNNGLYWNGSTLDINGDIGGTIGVIEVGNITIDNNGITATDGTNTTFSIDATTGIGSFTGVVVAQSGTLGSATFGSTTLDGQGAVSVSRIVSTSAQTGSLVVQGPIASNSIFPRGDNLHDLGEDNPAGDRYWRRIYLRNSPIVVSDENKKENITPVGNEYNNIILNTEVISYNNPGEDIIKLGIGARQFYGQFGEQAKPVLPRVDEGVFGADYVAFVPMLIKTVQTQQAQIQELEARLAALETNGEV